MRSGNRAEGKRIEISLPRIAVLLSRMVRFDLERTLYLDGTLARFSPIEYRLLLPMLDSSGAPVSLTTLAHAAYERPPDSDLRRVIDKHMEHIRTKLLPCGVSVRCVARYGYLLVIADGE